MVTSNDRHPEDCERCYWRGRAEAAEEKLAKAWDEGYEVASDDFVHSDYCGRKCQCMGVHGQPNPYRTEQP